MAAMACRLQPCGTDHGEAGMAGGQKKRGHTPLWVVTCGRDLVVVRPEQSYSFSGF
jgi:hypothetical protein